MSFASSLLEKNTYPEYKVQENLSFTTYNLVLTKILPAHALPSETENILFALSRCSDTG